MHHSESSVSRNQKLDSPAYYWMATFFHRCWFTCLIALAGWAWAQDLVAFFVMIALALLVDIVRNFKAPDLRVSVRELSDLYRSVEIEDRVDYPHNPKSYSRVLSMHLFLPPFATLIVIVAAPLLGGISPDNERLYDLIAFLSRFFDFLGDDIGRVIAMGGQERVPLVFTVYAVNIILTLASCAYLLFGTMHYAGIHGHWKVLHRRTDYPVGGIKGYFFKNPRLNVYGLVFVYIGFVLFADNIFIFSDSSYRLNYNIHESSPAFLWFSFSLSSAYLFGCLSYLVLIRVRIDACGMWKQLAEKVVPPDQDSDENNDGR